MERSHDYLERSFLPGRTLHLAGGFQRPAGTPSWRLAGPGEPAEPAGVGLRLERPDPYIRLELR